MRTHLASFIVMFGMVAFMVGPVAAKNEAQPNHPKLFNPNTDYLIAIGLPQGQPGEWVREDIPKEEEGFYNALCLKDLTSQLMFPAAAPAVSGSMFCLADLLPIGPFQLSATAIVRQGRNPSTGKPIVIPTKPHPHSPVGPSDKDIKKAGSKLLKIGSKGDAIIPNCSVLIENESIISGGTTYEEASRQHVVTCSSADGLSSILGSFHTPAIAEGKHVSLNHQWLGSRVISAQ